MLIAVDAAGEVVGPAALVDEAEAQAVAAEVDLAQAGRDVAVADAAARRAGTSGRARGRRCCRPALSRAQVPPTSAGTIHRWAVRAPRLEVSSGGQSSIANWCETTRVPGRIFNNVGRRRLLMLGIK
jgi:hypothetical protein